GNDLFIRNLNSQATTADIRLDARTDIFLDANDDILFRTGSPANTQMFIRDNGNIGMGTITPESKLHVASLEETAVFESSSTNNYIGIGNTINGTFVRKGYFGIFSGNEDIDVGTGYGNTVGKVHLVSNSSPRATLLNNGNFGIGTTDPTERLQVVGNALIDNNLFLNTSTIGIGYNSISYAGATASTLSGNFDFNSGTNGTGILIETSVSGVEGGGFYADGDYAVIWSPGDSDRLLRVYDEDDPSSPERWYVDGDGDDFKASDERLKENIETLEDIMPRLQTLRGVSYNWKTSVQEQEKGESGSTAIGLIAQEVEAVFPELVQTNEFGTKFVNYEGLIPVFIEAFKIQQNTLTEQQNELASKTTELEDLKAEITAIKAMMQQLLYHDRVQLIPDSSQPSEDIPSLQQNTPNPFKGVTTITYYVPKNTSQAFLQITDANGKVLERFEVAESGHGTLEIDATRMQNGQYFYSLILDGKLFESKQMLLSK
ncbi:MAG: tail fiber domain-containing protein, partial [Bacteroidota bacterium]